MKNGSAKTRVAIIGAGFAGLNAAKILAKHPEIHTTLIDRRNHHLFQPLLYQVATAGLSPADIATPVRSLFPDRANMSVILDEAKQIDLGTNSVICETENIAYDYLIVACGSNHQYFGHPEWEEFAPGLKTIEQATEIRRRILTAFEEAEKETDPAKVAAWTTFVIVGGGPTGVEMAGAISELSQHTIRSEYRNIDPGKCTILVVEAGPRLLAAFDQKLSDRASQDLIKLGVTLKTATRVTQVNEEGVETSAGFIPSKTVIWAAGVAPSPTGKRFVRNGAPEAVPLDPGGRVIVEKNLSIRGNPNVFVLGDQANFTGPDGKPLPGLAPVAMQQGTFAAKNILRMIKGEPAKEFRYLDKGMMATIGRKRAVVQTGKIRFSGFIAWMAWLLIHIYYLIGFRNRLFVFLQWFWSYVSYTRSARLIVAKDWHLKE